MIEFPILDLNPNPASQVLARYILQAKRWKIVLATDEHTEAIPIFKKMWCDGALVRIVNKKMLRAAKAAPVPMVN